MCAHRHLPVVVAVALLLCLLCVSTSAAVPAGCELDGTTLLSCAAYNATASGTRLVLRGLGITAVASSAFSGVTGVAQVDLSRNSLSLIAADTFAPLAGSITSLCVVSEAACVSPRAAGICYSGTHGARWWCLGLTGSSVRVWWRAVRCPLRGALAETCRTTSWPIRASLPTPLHLSRRR